ncbi:MAG: bifunctional UDP-N-acetylglucosamine diphosphorylase/glucosamine-1-phosphate N-acetyltransferase GlmU [Fimbriimonadaceae bacterium]|nr:bifunctional UDP-N-acetylglucosamine diphosphorylase/glucosamine-1-phosphate N-acetyltransferase GlmU [Fimbriimonadaceae bacterium]
MSSEVAGIILAAGKGTRMKSDTPKVLHEISGVPMVETVVRAMRSAGVTRIVIVIGHGAELVRARMGDGFEYAVQDPPMGTGDAVRVGMAPLQDFEGSVLVSAGDTPLLTGDALARLVHAQQSEALGASIATVELENPYGYGRVLFEGDQFDGIVEEKDATPEQKRLREVCVSVDGFDARALREALPKLTNENAQGEYYLTDVPLLMAKAGHGVKTVKYDDPTIFSGVNDRAQLADAQAVLRARINRQHLLNGVTMIDPSSTYIGLDVEIGNDTILFPNCVLEGKTRIGQRCVLGPAARVVNSVIGNDVRVVTSSIADSTVGDDAKIGPWATLRDRAVIQNRAKVGNYVEVKNSTLGEKASAAHLAYIGDADVGSYANIGAGTITANYDGFTKSRTVVGDRVFIGSNSTLVAPVTIGDGAFVVAGSVITHPVPDNAGAFGRARQENKPDWAEKYRARKQGNPS